MKRISFLLILIMISSCSFNSQGLSQLNCQNGSWDKTSQRCICDTGWTGELCNICADDYISANNTCIKNPCLDWDCGNGSCSLDASNTPVCSCEERWTGKHCEECESGYILHNENCVEDPCMDYQCGTGTCKISLDNGELVASCQCESPWTGEHCEDCENGYILYNAECVPDLCQNVDCGNGSCTQTDATNFYCDCADDYYGDNCQYKLIEDALVYKDASALMAVQMKNPRWGDFTNTVKMHLNADSGVNYDVFFSTQEIDINGFLHLDPCLVLTGDSTVYFEISFYESPYQAEDILQFSLDSTDIDVWDPEKFVYTDNIFKVYCQCNAGECSFSSAGR